MVTVEEHHHCKVCGNICNAGSQTCSAKCEQLRLRRAESRRTYGYLMYALIAFIAVLFLANLLHL